MKRPFQVAALGWFFIAVGIFNTAWHLWRGTLDLWIGVAAVVAGVFLLRGARWARWLVLVWLAFHVGVGALNSLSAAAPHAVLLVVVGYVLLGPPTSQYFQPGPAK